MSILLKEIQRIEALAENKRDCVKLANFWKMYALEMRDEYKAEIESLRTQLAQLAQLAQPTPSQSVDERAEFEKAATELGLLFCGRFIDEHYKLWQARAKISKPQPTSQDVGDELIKAMREGYKIQYYPPLEYLIDEANSEKAWGVERMQAPFCGNDGIRIWSASSPIAAVNKARKAIKDKQ